MATGRKIPFPGRRVAVHALELPARCAGRETQGVCVAGRVRVADFLFILLGFLGEQPVPERSAPEAVKLSVGWS